MRKLSLKMGLGTFHDMDARCEKVMENLDLANKAANSRMSSQIQSYDYRDNEYYDTMLALEDVLKKSIEQLEEEADNGDKDMKDDQDDGKIRKSCCQYICGCFYSIEEKPLEPESEMQQRILFDALK
jgi:hypothetical protein